MMVPEVYYCEYSRSSLEKVLYEASSNGFLDVKGSVNRDFKVKNAFGLHGKSPCFSGCAFLTQVRQGVGAYFLGYGDGVDWLD